MFVVLGLSCFGAVVQSAAGERTAGKRPRVPQQVLTEDAKRARLDALQNKNAGLTEEQKKARTTVLEQSTIASQNVVTEPKCTHAALQKKEYAHERAVNTQRIAKNTQKHAMNEQQQVANAEQQAANAKWYRNQALKQQEENMRLREQSVFLATELRESQDQVKFLEGRMEDARVIAWRELGSPKFNSSRRQTSLEGLKLALCPAIKYGTLTQEMFSVQHVKTCKTCLASQ